MDFRMIKIFLYTALFAFAVTSHAQGFIVECGLMVYSRYCIRSMYHKIIVYIPFIQNQRPIEVTGGINYHPAFLLNRQSKVSFDIGDLDIHQATFFTVYQLKDTIVENMILAY